MNILRDGKGDFMDTEALNTMFISSAVAVVLIVFMVCATVGHALKPTYEKCKAIEVRT